MHSIIISTRHFSLGNLKDFQKCSATTVCVSTITSAATFRNLTLQTEKRWREPPPQEGALHTDPEHPPFSPTTAAAGAGRCLPALVTAGSMILVLIRVMRCTSSLLKILPWCHAPLSVRPRCSLRAGGSKTPQQRYLGDGTCSRHDWSCCWVSLSSLPRFWTCTVLLCFISPATNSGSSSHREFL